MKLGLTVALVVAAIVLVAMALQLVELTNKVAQLEATVAEQQQVAANTDGVGCSPDVEAWIAEDPLRSDLSCRSWEAVLDVLRLSQR
jgi:hypothetical protein